MNARKIPAWMTRGWNPFLLFVICLLAEISTGFVPYNFWLRAGLFIPLLVSAFLVIETRPGGMLNPKKEGK